MGTWRCGPSGSRAPCAAHSWAAPGQRPPWWDGGWVGGRGGEGAPLVGEEPGSLRREPGLEERRVGRATRTDVVVTTHADSHPHALPHMTARPIVARRSRTARALRIAQRCLNLLHIHAPTRASHQLQPLRHSGTRCHSRHAPHLNNAQWCRLPGRDSRERSSGCFFRKLSSVDIFDEFFFFPRTGRPPDTRRHRDGHPLLGT